MKTDLKKWSTLFLFLCSTGVLFAQYKYCDIVRPDYQKVVVREILTCFSHGIEIDDDELAQFIVGETSPGYDPTLRPPIPDLFRDGGDFIFSWEDVPNYTFYEVSTLNMRTGEVTTELTKDNRFSFTKNGDYHAFLFATQRWILGEKRTRSASFIIIDEKPILTDGFATYPCTCNDDIIFSSGINAHSNGFKAPNSSSLNKLSIFPNPSSSEFNLSYELSSPQEVSILLVDAFGKTHRELRTPEQQFAGKYQLLVDLNGLPNGWYQCILKTADKWESASILKMDKG